MAAQMPARLLQYVAPSTGARTFGQWKVLAHALASVPELVHVARVGQRRLFPQRLDVADVVIVAVRVFVQLQWPGMGTAGKGGEGEGYELGCGEEVKRFLGAYLGMCCVCVCACVWMRRFVTMCFRAARQGHGSQGREGRE